MCLCSFICVLTLFHQKAARHVSNTYNFRTQAIKENVNRSRVSFTVNAAFSNEKKKNKQTDFKQ